MGSYNACTGFLDSTNDVVILETPLSGRKTPLYILFKQDETREIGEFAVEEIKYNLSTTFQYFTRILCKSNVESEKRFLTYRTTAEGQIVDESGPLAKGLTAQHLTSQFLSVLMFKQRVKLSEIDNALITVSDYENADYRRALLDSAKIAGLDNVKLISETRAVAMQYAE